MIKSLVKFVVSDVAYRPTVYKTGGENNIKIPSEIKPPLLVVDDDLAVAAAADAGSIMFVTPALLP